MFESLIGYYCGPALAGIKPSNIVSLKRNKDTDVNQYIETLNRQLNKKDIYIEILNDKESCVLVMVYRKCVLENHLNNKDMNEFLQSCGYPGRAALKDYIRFLRKRLSENSFPHEIGVFLGYPLNDITGFINHRDDGCLLTGEWKVYGDVKKAEELFLRYKRCRAALKKRIESGYTLAQIFCA